MKKILTLFLSLISFAIQLYLTYDFLHYCNKPWVLEEYLIIIPIVALIIYIKFSMYLFNRYSIELPTLIPEEHYRLILCFLFALFSYATIHNIILKTFNGYSVEKLFVILPLFAFTIILDYIETLEAIKKLSNNIH